MVEAANESRDHGDTRAADAGQESEHLRHAHDDCLTELERVQASVARGRPLVGGNYGANLGSSADARARQEDSATDDKKARGRDWRREKDSQRVLEHESDEASQDRGNDQEPAQTLI